MDGKKQKGFTLIEVLVVVAFLGLIASLLFVSLQGARSRARDIRRIAEMDQMRKSLEIYYSIHYSYPNNSGTFLATNWSDMLQILKDDKIISEKNKYNKQIGYFIKNIIPKVLAMAPPNPTNFVPQDPLFNKDDALNTPSYGYMVSSDLQSYRIRAQLENNNQSALSSALSGKFLYNSQSTGANACDKSLYLYCVGSPSQQNFTPPN